MYMLELSYRFQTSIFMNFAILVILPNLDWVVKTSTAPPIIVIYKRGSFVLP